MSNGMKAGVVVLVLVALGVWYAQTNKTMPDASSLDETSAARESSTANISSADASDASTDRDMVLIEAQLKALESDSSSADKASSDKPVNQEF